MTAMTLQRAKQVCNRIKAETSFSAGVDEDAYGGYRARNRAAAKTTFTTTVSISVDSPVAQQAEAYRRLLLGKTETMFKLMDIGTRIRIDASVKQASVGVSALVTERVMVDQKIKILDHLLETVENGVLDTAQVAAQAEAIKGRLGVSMSSGTTATVNTVLLTQEDRHDFTTKLREARSRLMAIDDELAHLNAVSKIEINDADMAVLKTAGLA